MSDSIKSKDESEGATRVEFVPDFSWKVKTPIKITLPWELIEEVEWFQQGLNNSPEQGVRGG